MKKLALSLVALAACRPLPAAALPPLFADGRTEWAVVVEDAGDPCLAYAAVELTNALKRVSGADFPVVTNRAGVAHAVRLAAGDAAFAKERVAYRLDGGDLLVAGNQPRAALHAAYAFLDRELGVRWLWPGEDGAFYPARASWSFPEKFGFDYEPKLWFRGFHHCGDWRNRQDFLAWQTRNYANVHRHGNWDGDRKYGQYSMISLHNANLHGREDVLKEHPECLALLAGRRSLNNVCFTSRRGAKLVAESIAGFLRGRQATRDGRTVPVDVAEIFPTDNMDYCECGPCRAKGVSEGWFGYYNWIVEELRPQFPDIRFATLAYQGYLDPPKARLKDTLFVEYASHPRCHVHRWGDASCARNARELERLRAWRRRGDVAVGHYAYEYDALTGRKQIFMPFFSIVGDAVEVAANEGLVTAIPEVPLSPGVKDAPDVWAMSVQNRLTILYYARKMWDPSLALDAFLDDLCRTAFGAAAKPMKDYFLALDAAWGAMDLHVGLFAGPMAVSESLLRDDAVRARAARDLAEAERLVADDARRLANVRREKALYGQIAEFREMRTGGVAAFNLPRVAKGARPPRGGAPKLALEKARGVAGANAASGWWTAGDEIVVVFKTAKASASVLFVDSDAERYSFAWKAGLAMQRRVSNVGVEAALWKPAWTVARSGEALVFQIPVSAFGRAPAAGEEWEARFAADGEAAPWGEEATTKLVFRESEAVDRPLVYFIGDHGHRSNEHARRHVSEERARAAADGWDLIACTNRAALAANAAKASVYYFLIPDSKMALDPETAATIRARVRAGGALYVKSFWSAPLDGILGDPSLKTRIFAPQDLAISQRKAQFVRAGDWLRKPWDIERGVRNAITPAYLLAGLEPAGAWTAYASMRTKSDPDEMRPFVSAMRYGKGVVILSTWDRVSDYRVIDNLRRAEGAYGIIRDMREEKVK